MLARIRFTAPLYAVFMLSFLLTACHTAQKFVESGDYDGAIAFCVQKLRGKAKKKTELVQGLELAFQKAQARDLLIADHLANQNRPENWEKINAIHRKIRDRQNKIAPLLPLSSSDGYLAQFDFVRIEQLESDSREKAAEYMYTRAESLLRQAESGDRQAAREAYGILEDLEQRYFRQYRDKDQMMQDARYLGTTHVLLEVRNQSDQRLPRQFEDDLLSIGAADLNSAWRIVHIDPQPGSPIDYRVVFNIRRVDISPERITERAYIDEKEIEDGWEYVLDKRGNVKKDTAGNDIKVPRHVRIRAHVLEVFQSKAARLAGTIEVFDGNSRSRLDARDLSTEVLFEHYAATFTGDARALSRESRRLIGNQPLPFPGDADMLVQVADRLKPEISAELRRNRAIF